MYNIIESLEIQAKPFDDIRANFTKDHANTFTDRAPLVNGRKFVTRVNASGNNGIVYLINGGPNAITTAKYASAKYFVARGKLDRRKIERRGGGEEEEEEEGVGTRLFTSVFSNLIFRLHGGARHVIVVKHFIENWSWVRVVFGGYVDKRGLLEIFEASDNSVSSPLLFSVEYSSRREP